MVLLPIQRMRDRVESAKRTNDDAYFRDLMILGEMIVKTAIAGMIASIDEGPERHQYRLKYFAVRESTPGGWASIMDEMRRGVSKGEFHTVIPMASGNEFQQLTSKSQPGDWQHDSVKLLFKCLKLADYTSEALGQRPRAYEWFHRFSELRNKAKSHRAPFSAITSAMCPLLQESINLFLANFRIFGRPWGHVSRNLNDTYQVVRWSESNEGFSQLEDACRCNDLYQDGVYIVFNSQSGDQTLCKVDLMDVRPNGMDVYLPNGNFKDRHYEMLSYVEDYTKPYPSLKYQQPPNELPTSETHGKDVADTHGMSGSTIHNLPNKHSSYIPRVAPEDMLYKEIMKDDQHPIITLNGRGGIGKTWLALEVLHRIAVEETFDFIVWFSARNIDLLEEGPKDVKPHIKNKQDVANVFANLLETWFVNEGEMSEVDTVELIQKQMQARNGARILFVFDNFESLDAQSELYRWIDTYIRLPNKVVITTRKRQFTSDTPIELRGMSVDESRELIDRTATKLAIRDLVPSYYEAELMDLSDGHPYVLKILLGEIKRQGRYISRAKMLADKEIILDALFENIYGELSPLARRIFLTICEMKTIVAEIAIHAVLIGRGNEPLDIPQAVDELHFSSLIEKNNFDDDDEFYCSVPYVAAVFGTAKLKADPLVLTIQGDTAFLKYFSTAQKSDINRGVRFILRNFYENVEVMVARDSMTVESFKSIMEHIARRYPEGWIQLAKLYQMTRQSDNAESALKQCIETSSEVSTTREAWEELVSYYKSTERFVDELFALVRRSQLPVTRFATISDSADRYNQLRNQTRHLLTFDENEKISKPLIDLMESRINEADARDCSRLGWLYFHNSQPQKALQAVERGLDLDPANYYCLNLKNRALDALSKLPFALS